jgi:HPt (histidine-containing phosphotransfer) domain-containing protein
MTPQPEDIDLTRFHELSDGDADSLAELIELYTSKTNEQLANLEKAVRDKQTADIARIAHSLVGANAMMGITTLLPGLRKLEALSEKNDLREATSIFKTVSSEYQKIQAALKKNMDGRA